MGTSGEKNNATGPTVNKITVPEITNAMASFVFAICVPPQNSTECDTPSATPLDSPFENKTAMQDQDSCRRTLRGLKSTHQHLQCSLVVVFTTECSDTTRTGSG